MSDGPSSVEPDGTGENMYQAPRTRLLAGTAGFHSEPMLDLTSDRLSKKQVIQDEKGRYSNSMSVIRVKGRRVFTRHSAK